jgi:hypothetical protein
MYTSWPSPCLKIPWGSWVFVQYVELGPWPLHLHGTFPPFFGVLLRKKVSLSFLTGTSGGSKLGCFFFFLFGQTGVWTQGFMFDSTAWANPSVPGLLFRCTYGNWEVRLQLVLVLALLQCDLKQPDSSHFLHFSLTSTGGRQEPRPGEASCWAADA